MKKSSYDIIKRPVLSEKSYDGIASKHYTFLVDKSATKTEIKDAIRDIFQVEVEHVNVVNYQGKMKTMGRGQRTPGRQPAFKKAYVKLTPDSKTIEFFDSLS
jgi:large subunit ribosomal protein L23